MLFKGIIFSIKEETYDSETIQIIARKIMLHAGIVSKNKKINYMIVNDGGSGNVLMDFGKVKDKSYIVVSHRWIDYCIRHKAIANVEKNKQIYLLPLPFSSPYKDVDKYSLAMSGLRQEDKVVIGRIFEAMGGKLKKELKEATHIITDKQAATKAIEAAKKNRSISIIDAGWILDYMEYGIPPNEAKYNMEFSK